MSKQLIATIAGLAFAAATATARQAGDAHQAAEEVTLKAGDPAPPLSIETWIKGAPVEALEQGKVYIVEFWATWCGPCVRSMPHLTALQKEYGPKGVTIISVTSEDPNNSLEKVQEMVKEKGDGMGYTVAWDRGAETKEAYMKASAQPGIPCSFLIDGKGTVAYIGHPMWLDIALPQVLAGTWDVEKGREQIEQAEERLKAVFEAASEDPAKALELLVAFAAEHPKVAEMFETMHFKLLLDLGRLDEGYALGQQLVTKAMHDKDAMTLSGIAGLIVDPEQKLERRDLELALKAAKSANELTEGKEPLMLMTLARVHSAKGEHDAAISLQEKAIELADDERFKDFLRGVLEELQKAAGK